MNWVLVRTTMQRLITRPASVVVILAYGLYALLMGMLQTGAAQMQIAGVMNNPSGERWVGTAKAAWVLVWAIGAGLLGQERSSGYLPLLLSRPISRATYVLSRWAGLVLSVLAIDFTLFLLVIIWIATKHQAPDLSAIVQRWAWFAYFSVLAASWLTLLSACFPGHGDFLYFFLLSLIAYFIGVSAMGSEGLGQAHGILTWFWEPGGSTFDQVTSGTSTMGPFSALAFVGFAALCLFAATFVMKRKDISYVS